MGNPRYRSTVSVALLLLLFLLLLLLVAGCVPPTPAPPPVASSTPASTVTPAPVTQEVVATPTLAPPSVGPNTDRLVADLEAALDIGPASERRVAVRALDGADDAQVFVAYTFGFRDVDPFRNHMVSIQMPVADGWQEQSRVELECPHFLDENSVEQVALEPTGVWLAVHGGTGAHSGCFDLLRWDGQSLTIAASGFNSSPGAGDVVDVDGDGRLDVLLNDTDPYIFCYACGVRLYAARILYWDGAQLVQVALQTVPDDYPADVRSFNNTAVALAEASLLSDALAQIEQAEALAPKDPVIHWNAVWIRHHLEARRQYAEFSPFPLLNHVFAGDWEAAFDVLWETGLPTIVSDTPIPDDSAASGFNQVTGEMLVQFAGPALALQPERAAIHALGAWGRFLLDPRDPLAAEGFVQASLLAPDDERLGGIAAALGGVQRGVTPPDEYERVRFAPGGTSAILEAEIGPHEQVGYVLGIAAGQTLYIRVLAGDPLIRVLDTDGSLMVPGGDGGYAIVATGDYKVQLAGGGSVRIEVEIPPR